MPIISYYNAQIVSMYNIAAKGCAVIPWSYKKLKKEAWNLHLWISLSP